MAEPETLMEQQNWQNAVVDGFFAWNNDEDSQSSTIDNMPSPLSLDPFNSVVDPLDVTLDQLTGYGDEMNTVTEPVYPEVHPLFPNETMDDLIPLKTEIKTEPKPFDDFKPSVPAYTSAISDKRPKKRKRSNNTTLPDPTKVVSLKKHEEALVAIDSVSFNQFENTFRSSHKVTLAEDKILKAIRRKINNRESARRSRANAKMKVSQLQEEIEILKEDTSLMKQRLRQLEGRNQALANELNHHKSVVRNNPAIRHLFEGFAYARALAKSEQISAGAKSLLVFAVILCFGLTWAFQGNQQTPMSNRIQLPSMSGFNPSGDGRVFGGKYNKASLNARRMYEDMGPDQMLTTQQLLRAHTLKIRQQKLKQDPTKLDASDSKKLDASDATVVTQPLKPNVKNATAFDSQNRQETTEQPVDTQAPTVVVETAPEQTQEAVPKVGHQMKQESTKTQTSADSTSTTSSNSIGDDTQNSNSTVSNTDAYIGEPVDFNGDDLAVPVVKVISRSQQFRVVQVPA